MQSIHPLSNRIRLALVASTCAALVQSSQAQFGIPETLLLDFGSYSASGAPGIPVSQTPIAELGFPSVSANGHWIVRCKLGGSAAANAQGIIVVDGAWCLREDDPAPAPVGGTWGNWGVPLASGGGAQQRVGIDDSGAFVFYNHNSNGKDQIVRGTSQTSFTVVAEENAPVSGLPGALYKSPMSAPVIASQNGIVGFMSRIRDASGAGRDAVVLGSSVVAQTGLTIPANQHGGATLAYSDFQGLDWSVDRDGSRFAFVCDRSGGTRGTAVDNAFVAEDGVALPGGQFAAAVTALHRTWIDRAGNWYALGTNTGNQSWILRNGAVLATSGAPIVPGSSETWSTSGVGVIGQSKWRWVRANAVGQVVVAGPTSAASTQDYAIVLDGTVVVAREGDALDLDNNGIADALLGDIDVVDGADLTDAGDLYFVAGVRDLAGSSRGNGLFRLRLGVAGAPPTTYCTGKVNSLGCVPRILAQGTPSATSTSGFVLSSTSSLNQRGGVLLHGLSGPAFLPFSGGSLCVQAPKHSLVLFSGGSPLPANDCSGAYSLDMNSWAHGLLGGAPDAGLLVPGARVHCQWYSRDPADPSRVSLSDALQYFVGP